MINARTKINAIITEAVIYNDISKSSRTSTQINNVFICLFSQEFDDENINKKYINMNYTDKLNILTAVLYSDKQKNKVSSNTLKKIKIIINK